jgi:thiocyanate hydrolase subunit alpha
MNKFKIGDRVIVKDLPSLFHTRTQGYTRNCIGEVVMLRPDWVIPEDEAWGREDGRAEPFYMVRFKLTDLWSDYTGEPFDTLETEFSERWLDSV